VHHWFVTNLFHHYVCQTILINVDDIKTNLWRSGFVIPIRYTQNKFYDYLLLQFCDIIFIFVIIFQAKSSSLATYEKIGEFVI
jgi:hypothetical protein